MSSKVQRLELSDEEWRRRLTPQQFEVARKGGYGTGFHRYLLGRNRRWNLSLRMLRSAAVPVRHEIRFRHRLAELLGHYRQRRRLFPRRSQLRHGADGSVVQPVRRTFGSRVSRRPRADWVALLHELGVAAARSRRTARRRVVDCPRPCLSKAEATNRRSDTNVFRLCMAPTATSVGAFHFAPLHCRFSSGRLLFTKPDVALFDHACRRQCVARGNNVAVDQSRDDPLTSKAVWEGFRWGGCKTSRRGDVGRHCRQRLSGHRESSHRSHYAQPSVAGGRCAFGIGHHRLRRRPRCHRDRQQTSR